MPQLMAPQTRYAKGKMTQAFINVEISSDLMGRGRIQGIEGNHSGRQRYISFALTIKAAFEATEGIWVRRSAASLPSICIISLLYTMISGIDTVIERMETNS
jgi:hypothetical protein